MAAKARVQKRLYYKIGEACKALGIQPYVLRYWETEFPALSPSKSRSGQRVYSEKELEIIRRVKQLLYDEGYTIAGAKKKLEGELAAGTLGESPLAAAPSSGSLPLSAPPAAAAAAEAGESAAPPVVSTVAPLSALQGAETGPGVVRRGAGAVAAAPQRAMPLPLAPRVPTGEQQELSAREPAAASPMSASSARPGTAGAALDTGAAERIETLRKGIRKALQEAR